jgi:hypothetical protein
VARVVRDGCGNMRHDQMFDAIPVESDVVKILDDISCFGSHKGILFLHTKRIATSEAATRMELARGPFRNTCTGGIPCQPLVFIIFSILELCYMRLMK